MLDQFQFRQQERHHITKNQHQQARISFLNSAQKSLLLLLFYHFVCATMVVGSIIIGGISSLNSSIRFASALQPMRVKISTSSLEPWRRSGSMCYTSSSKCLFPLRETRCQMTIADTPLGTDAGSSLLTGLDVYSVPAKGDSHPLSVYGINSDQPDQSATPVLLLHGRTWSSVPVYHLLGTGTGATSTTLSKKNNVNGNDKEHQSRSLMEALYEQNLQPYAMDFRGFGGTPKDSTGFVEPNRCVEDTESVLEWIKERHSLTDSNLPALLGWSQGALVAQLAAQRTNNDNPTLSKLVLYGSIYDPSIRYPREPLYTSKKGEAPDIIENDFDSAIEDFTLEGTIPPEPAQIFAEAALLSDPVKAIWKHLYQFNNCDPARVHVPTLVVAGDQDPYAPPRVQQELFSNLGRGSDRTYSVLADSDHAVHLLEGRDRFINIVSSFIHNGKRSELHREY